MLSNLMAQGCAAISYWTDGQAVTETKFRQNFPSVSKEETPDPILDDPTISLVLIAAVPADRAALAIRAMRAGKDVIVDKPGCTTLEQLIALREAQTETGRIWSVNFSERFQVPAVTKAEELVFGGAIGRVIQTVGLGPHKRNLKTRPAWFFERARYGGILCDIASHQVDQFLHFTGSSQAEVAHAFVGNTSLPEHPEFQDFGEIVLKSSKGHGYIRVDWFTPNGLPTWGDGRLFIQGTDGHIELRKYTDIGHPHRTDNLYLVNGEENSRIDCKGEELPYFRNLIADVQDRSSTAMSQDHAFTTMDIAIRAQMKAEA
ncbi:MAG: Gfo/Idh/MocA family oxidoreductase [Pseudomonadota bacterium]